LATIGPSVTKKCKICGEIKPFSEFHRNGTWRRPECKKCFNELTKKYNKLKREHPTPELGTACQCCSRTDELLTWDHCHKTTEHRGWLCHCNTGIGKLGDNLQGVTNAMNYLLRPRKIASDTNGDDDCKEEEEREGPTTKGQPD